MKNFDSDNYEDSDEYIDKWINLEVTLTEWLNHSKIDHWEIILQLDIDEIGIEEIKEYQISLFRECYWNLINHFINRLKNYDMKAQEIVALEHLRVIDLFVNSTEVNSFIISFLRPFIFLNETDYLPILLKFKALQCFEGSNSMADYNVSRTKYTNIHNFNAHMLFYYQKELIRFLEQIKHAKNKTGHPINELSRTKEFISKELDTIDRSKGWAYVFTNKNDYNTFLDLLTCYFEYKPYFLPQKVIRLTRDCKTRLAKSLRPIHKELSEKPLRTDTEFFNLLRVLNHFEKLTDIEIYNSITR